MFAITLGKRLPLKRPNASESKHRAKHQRRLVLNALWHLLMLPLIAFFWRILNICNCGRMCWLPASVSRRRQTMPISRSLTDNWPGRSGGVAGRCTHCVAEICSGYASSMAICSKNLVHDDHKLGCDHHASSELAANNRVRRREHVRPEQVGNDKWCVSGYSRSANLLCVFGL